MRLWRDLLEEMACKAPNGRQRSMARIRLRMLHKQGRLSKADMIKDLDSEFYYPASIS